MFGLKFLYANGNQLNSIPDELITLESLVELNIANNCLENLTDAFYVQFGDYDASVGTLKDGIKKDVKVTVVGNPFTKTQSQSPVKSWD